MRPTKYFGPGQARKHLTIFCLAEKQITEIRRNCPTPQVVIMQKAFSLKPIDSLTRGCASGPCCGLCPQTLVVPPSTLALHPSVAIVIARLLYVASAWDFTVSDHRLVSE